MSAESYESSPGDFPPHLMARFDYLMSKYLAQEASDSEKDELRQLVENGFGKRFREWIDTEYSSHADTGNIPDKAREEILVNILGSAPSRRRSVKIRWSWAAAVLLALGSVLWLTLRGNRPAEKLLTNDSSETLDNEPLVFRGKQFLYLPDGSSVLMNENSELRYSAASFESGAREVKLTGEAYFDIAHKPESPFLVRTGPVVTRVLGTAFNINAGQKEVIVTVTRGLVEVSSEEKVFGRIRPDEQITVNTETRQYNTASVHAEEEITWKNSYLVFDNIDLAQAGEIIRGHYGIELRFSDPQLLKCRITASFLNNEDLATVLTVLSEMMGASYTIEGNRVLIKGGSCS